MSTTNLPSGPQTVGQPFRAVLAPYRSLSPLGFLVLMAVFGIVSFIAGIAFLMMGAWPVFGFFGLDIALVYVAFRLNYRAGRQYETIEIADHRLVLTRVDPAGHAQTIEFNPYWASVRLRRGVDGRTSLALASHGRETPFGSFLTDDERAEFADVLRAALQKARTGSAG